ncbi:Ank3 [Symbiodinium natans]|uniref:Ank3 protein n=1 Tax=Symbiodinium natans TaxID=878477 RepID=A0A812L988_9DINO|nr:Ank3 [Symbiodinium natans]
MLAFQITSQPSCDLSTPFDDTDEWLDSKNERASFHSFGEPAGFPEGVPREPNRRCHERHVRSLNKFRAAVELCPETFVKIAHSKQRRLQDLLERNAFGPLPQVAGK